jgi:hypothetical protein
MNEKQKNNFLWEYLYIIGLTIIIGILALLFFRIPTQFVLVILSITIFGEFIVWKKPLSKKLLYINDLLLLCAPLCISFIITFIFIHTTDSFVGIVAGVAIIDVFSFTRSGRNTLNAKLSSNINTLARLSVCLPVPKKPGLQPVIGVGDLNYYSLITMFSLKTGGLTAGLIAVFIIITGQIVNIIFIAIMKKKLWMKGFPATLFPGLFIILAVILNIL